MRSLRPNSTADKLLTRFETKLTQQSGAHSKKLSKDDPQLAPKQTTIFAIVTNRKWLNTFVRIDQDQITAGEEVDIQILLELPRTTDAVHLLSDLKALQDAIEALDFKLFENMQLRKYDKSKLGTESVLICPSKSSLNTNLILTINIQFLNI